MSEDQKFQSTLSLISFCIRWGIALIAALALYSIAESFSEYVKHLNNKDK